MSVGVKPRRIDKVRVRHAKLCRLLVHQGDERLFAARHMLGQRDGRVVGARDRGRLEQIVDRKLFARFKPDLRSAHRLRMLGARHHVAKRDLPAVERLHHEQQRHHLCDRRGRQLLVGVFFKKHPSRALFNEDRRTGRQRIVGRRGRFQRRQIGFILRKDRRRRRKHYDCRQENSGELFGHSRTPLASSFRACSQAPVVSYVCAARAEHVYERSREA